MPNNALTPMQPLGFTIQPFTPNLRTDIQLFGSVEQVNLAKALADELAAGKSFKLDPLINSLRNDLRAQLKLGKVEGNVRWIRFKE